MSDYGMPAKPIASQYTDPNDYTNAMFDWLRDYTDRRIKHRAAAIEIVAMEAANAAVALRRGEENPGWVITMIRAVQGHADANDKKLSRLLAVALTLAIGLFSTMATLYLTGLGK